LFFVTNNVGGTIVATADGAAGVAKLGTISTFSNSGQIQANGNYVTGIGIGLGGTIGVLTNTSTGAIVANGTDVPYPPRTADFHHEVELVVAIGRGGAHIAAADALSHVYGYAVGNDLTRRDLQADARKRGLPWDSAKGFDHSAPLAAIHTVEQVGHPTDARIWLKVNEQIRQDSNLSQMIWSVPEIIAELSALYMLQPGDLIFTGTPDGIGPLVAGDTVTAGIYGLDTLQHRVVAGRG
jgi:fumarylpyruvate hydrolase